ncbi:glycosyltransferase family 2 protein [Parabacteroides chinchillae]|uniref:Glycosyltransferase, catalytic subunit of cellulose synthase and poly-beta-1,6-N-acetylglucosamine synthase n=1 Tax=Parabacteroides chinchillae TaxID=871327 RepID=A0A8G2F5B6_9BACT|nr:glycosyltransferase family 2 protein [Parabacteroides chinchillae]SEG20458.1 Glycosyltransferase, catalytic subunit of cellulose synthase and poly-beta-1,6-N-acetylglucosamine synthase [Parabacteroides chinchillae]
MENYRLIIEILFWFAVFLVFYTYLGYGILLFILVKVKELFYGKSDSFQAPEILPEVTLFIAAYNEEDIIRDKMMNCQALAYPKDKLKIIWITDGSTDNTNNLLSKYPEVTTLYQPKRQGKTAALNRGIKFVTTPFIVFTDANTMLNKDAITEIIKCFSNSKVGCVAGEKRVEIQAKQGATAGEGIYWKYESTLKDLDFRLYSAVGAAGELFAIRTNLFEQMPDDTLLDDFILSLRIAQKGYKIAYCKNAYAIESASLNMQEEEKRKMRIAAGGLQSIWRLRSLLNVFRFRTLSFQYISHRVLRWTITPLFLFILIPLNLLLIKGSLFYTAIFILQTLFYIMAYAGYQFEQRQLRSKSLFIPYYFLFMNINVIKGFFYLKKNKGNGAWIKAKRNNLKK